MSIVTYYAHKTFKSYEKDALWVAHTERVKSEVMAMVSVSKSLSMKLRSMAINGDTLIFVDFNDSRKEIEMRYELLDSLVVDNQKQVQNLDSLKDLIDDHFIKCSVIIHYAANKLLETESLITLLASEGRVIDAIGLLRNEIIYNESLLLHNRSIEREKSANLAPLTLLILALFALSLISYLFINTFTLLDKNQIASRELQLKVSQLGMEIDKNVELHHLLRRVVNSSTNGIQAFESIRNEDNEIIDFRATIVNNTAAEIVHVSEAQQLKSTLLTITPGNKEAGLFDMYVEVVNSQKTAHKIHNYEHDGIETWFDTTAVANGDGFVVTFTDISEEKMMLRTLEKQKSDLESANEELERFAYVASHDLQEPLRKIRTFGDRLADRYNDALEERGRDYITRMRSAAERMQILINDLLKFSRISRNEIPKDEVSLSDCLNKVLETLELEISNNNATIHKTELPVIIGDAFQMQQLFQNLLTNSLKYRKEGIAPEIFISSEKVEEVSESPEAISFWKIDFKDNGIGFDNQYKNQIFEVFERLHGRTEYQGTGIGLALCEKIVSRHHGRIAANGEIGIGAIFSIFLPVNSN